MAQKNILSIFSGDDKENNNNFNMDLFQVNNFEPKNQINSDLNLTQGLPMNKTRILIMPTVMAVNS